MSKSTRSKGGKPVKILSIILACVVVLSLGTYGVGYAISGDRTPRDASVDGIPIGGLSQAEAEATLERELGPRATAPFTLQIDDESFELTPADLGLAVDIPATIAQSGIGRNADPRHIWKVLAGGGDLDPVVTVDKTVLQQAVAELAEEVKRKSVDAKVAFTDDSEVKYTKPVTSRALDAERATQLITEAYLVTTELELPVIFTDPEITDDDAADAKAFAEKVVSGPVVLKLDGGGEYEVPVSTLTKSYSFEVEDGTVVPKLDAKKLYELNKKGLADLPTEEPKNARVEIKDGKPHVVASVDGTTVDQKLLAEAVKKVVEKSGDDRETTVTPNGKKAEYTTEDAEKAGVKEVVSEFTTYFPHDPVRQYRSTNLGVVARLINNTYLKPGDQFSLNGEIGERTREKGFVDGYFIEGGILKLGLAGGISQSATTVFNAAFFAGVQLDQWQPHTLYFSRYPAGRESTVYLPTIDVKFTNDTPYGMVVEAWVKPAPPGGTGSITVRIWSTKHYSVETSEPTKSGYYSGTTRWVDDPNCQYQAPIQGFTASYYRKVSTQDGEVVKNENYSWKYSAGDEIRCGTKPDDEDD